MKAGSQVAVKRRLTLVNGIRGFRMTILRTDDVRFGLRLDETFGEPESSIAAPIVRTTARQTSRVMDAILGCVRRSGYRSGVLSSSRQDPIRLDEAEGVQLALVLLTTQPISKYERVRSLIAGINAMSIEEKYYWYAKCVGVEAGSARKALRILLADE